MASNIKVSILIPVYNAEQTLAECLTSLESQNYNNIELIFVNDCSKDKSLEILETFNKKKQSERLHIKIINHEYNQGVAASRNTALENASGDYIYWVDADDYIEKNAIKDMVDAAEQYKTDIVGIDWFLTFNKNERYIKQAPFNTCEEAIKNFMYGVARWNLWLFMCRRHLYIDNGIKFTPGDDMGEDLMVTIKLFLNANKATSISKPYYHYRQLNSSSLTKTYSQNHIIQVTHNINEIQKYFEERDEHNLSKLINFLKLNIKLPLLMSDKKENYEQWYKWFNEANGYVLKNPKLSFRTQLIQWLAAHRQFNIVKCYYLLIYRFVYGIIYK